MTLPIALTIAGSDPSGGAGIQADLKTFHQRHVYGMGVISLLTVQNTRAVKEVLVIGPEKVAAQLKAILEDIPPHAVKLGALGHEGVIRAIAPMLRELSRPLVVDPVMMSKQGVPLLVQKAIEVLKKEILPLATLITPNLDEAEKLTGKPVQDVEAMKEAAKRISDFGPKAVLIKGGHLEGDAVDVFYQDGKVEHFSAKRLDQPHTHGTGCAYSAVITAELAKGQGLVEAIGVAKKFITAAIEKSSPLGQGIGPLDLHVNV